MTPRQSIGRRRPATMTLADLDAWIVAQEAKKRETVAADPFKKTRTAPGRAVPRERHGHKHKAER